PAASGRAAVGGRLACGQLVWTRPARWRRSSSATPCERRSLPPLPPLPHALTTPCAMTPLCHRPASGRWHTGGSPLCRAVPVSPVLGARCSRRGQRPPPAGAHGVRPSRWRHRGTVDTDRASRHLVGLQASTLHPATAPGGLLAAARCWASAERFMPTGANYRGHVSEIRRC